MNKVKEDEVINGVKKGVIGRMINEVIDGVNRVEVEWETRYNG